MRNISIFHRSILSVIIVISFVSVTIIYFVNIYYLNLVEQRQHELKRQVDVALSIIDGHRKKAEKSGKSRSAADHEAFEQIEQLTYGESGYFYIFQGPVLRYHGLMPHLKGQNLLNVKDVRGNYLIRRQIEEIRNKGESSFKYAWLRKDSTVPVAKVSYNRLVPGTEYWLGTGVYIDDLDAVFWNGIKHALVVIAIISVLLAIFSHAIASSITVPLLKVRSRMVSLAAGDTSSPVPEVEAVDEVGEMARTVEVFRENKKYARELEQINSQIEQQALHDPLTGLANRRYFDTHFMRLRENCAKTGEKIFLFHVDLDRFKDTNDTMGHVAGDLVLKHTANVLKSLTREQDFIARIGGDEFLVIGPCRGDNTKAERLAEKIINALSEPLPYEGRFCRFGASIGIASESADTIELGTLIRQADMALYCAKDKGRNRFEVFSRSLEFEITSKNRKIEEFMDGLDLGHLVPYYQPQFNTKTLDVIGVEVLARWIHPEKGVLTPDSFLSIAEDQKVMDRINKSITIQALRDCLLLRNSEVEIPKLAVNFSLESLRDPDLMSWLDNLMPFPTRLSMELIESISFENCDEVVRSNIKKIKERDIDIEIDDFGSGRASILGLLEVKPHRLKIDRKLVEPIVNSVFHKRLLASIVEMGTSLDIDIIAEGVETMEQLAYLRELGLEAFQGFVLARPMSFAELKSFLKNETWRQAA